MFFKQQQKKETSFLFQMLSHKRALVAACDKQLADICAWQQQCKQELATIHRKQALLESEIQQVQTERNASLYYLKHPLFSLLEHHLPIQAMMICTEYATCDYCMKCDSWHPIHFCCLKDVLELKPTFSITHTFESAFSTQYLNNVEFVNTLDNEVWEHIVYEMRRLGKTIAITRMPNFDWLATKVCMRMFGPRIYFGRECGPTFEFYDVNRRSYTNDYLHLFTATAKRKTQK